jgi:hypothetical protein
MVLVSVCLPGYLVPPPGWTGRRRASFISSDNKHMCGIVGYIGSQQADEILLAGLQRLEYRGYDSAGIATINHGLNVVKKKGKVSELVQALGLIQTRPLLRSAETPSQRRGRNTCYQVSYLTASGRTV